MTKKETEKFKKTVKEYKSRIKAGIRYLDGRKKGWWKKIDINELQLENTATCVLGQAFQDYWNEVDQWNEGADKEKSLNTKEAVRYGFAIEEEPKGILHDYDLLTHLWRCALIDLRVTR